MVTGEADELVAKLLGDLRSAPGGKLSWEKADPVARERVVGAGLADEVDRVGLAQADARFRWLRLADNGWAGAGAKLTDAQAASLAELEGQFARVGRAEQALHIDLAGLATAVRHGYSETCVVRCGKRLERVLKAVWRHEGLSSSSRRRVEQLTLQPLLDQCAGRLPRSTATCCRIIQQWRNAEAHDSPVVAEPEDAVYVLRMLVRVLDWYQRVYLDRDGESR